MENLQNTYIFNVQDELQEFVFLNENGTNISMPSTSNTQINMEYKWTVNNSKLLIDLYTKYRNKVGTLQIRSLKRLWEIIAEELRKLGIHVTANNCLNRWRVLERNYKKFIDNNNKTGRGRKYFEYEKEMEEVFGKKKNVHPEILLGSNTRDHLQDETNTKGHNLQNNELNENPAKTATPLEINFSQVDNFNQGAENSPQPATKQNEEMPSITPVKASKSRALRKKASTMEKIRLDRKVYYDERLVLERKKIEQMERRNQLIEERNNILKENNCKIIAIVSAKIHFLVCVKLVD